MTKNILKRTLAGMLAVLTVAATVPADVSWSELLGGTAVVASAETAAAEFAKTTVDTIESDLKNNFGAVSEETVDAWKAENDETLKAERDAAAGTDMGSAYLIVVYAIDEDLDKYIVKYLNDNGGWSSGDYTLDGLKNEMNTYNSVVYYSTQTTIPFEEYPFTMDQFYYQFPSSVDVLKINKIEALVAIDKKPDWGLIQISDGSEIKQNYFTDLNNGVHKYVWDKNNLDNAVEGASVYGQIMLGSERDGQYGSLVGYKLYMEGQNVPVVVGDWTYPISVVPTGLKAHCGDTLEDVELSNRSDNDQGTWSWKEPDTDVGEAGINTFTAVFTPDDDSLKTVEFDVDVAVSKIDFTLEGAEDLVYDGDPHTLVKGDIPEGTKFSLTEPSSVVDYDSEKGLISPWITEFTKKKSAAWHDERDSEFYYYDAAGYALVKYSEAIDLLKEGNEDEASNAINSAKEGAAEMPGCGYTPSSDDSDAVNYIEEHIVGEDFEAFKARFGSDTTDWKDTAEATDAGDYTVWYKGSGNYSDTIKTVDVTIAKADFSLKGAEGLTYTGKPQNLIEGDIPEGTKFSLTEPTSGLDYDAEMELIEPLSAKLNEQYKKYLNSGNTKAYTYYGLGSSALKKYSGAIGALKEGDETSAAENLASAKANAEYMKDLGITPSDDVLDAIDYIEKHIIGVDFEAFKARFEGDSTEWLDTAEATDAGDYTVWYKGTGNYSDTVKTVDVTIAKADLKVTAPKPNELTFDGTAQELVTPGSVENGTMQYAVTDTSVSSAPADGWSEDVPKETKAGTYRVWYKGAAEDSDNYNDSKPAYVDVTITKEDIEVTAPTANKLTYNGSAQELVKAGKASAGTMQYALGTSDKEAPASGYSDKLPTATNAGTYYVWYKVVGDAAHDDTQPACVTVKIAAESITKTKYSVRNRTYTGKALKPGSKVVYNGKRLKKGRDYTITYKNNKKVGIGTAVIKGIGNYKGTVKTTFNVRPKKPVLKSVTSPQAKRIKITWKKVTQATGYNLKVSTDKTFKGKALVKNVFAKKNSFVSKTFSGMKSGKTYYVKVRAYKQTKSGKIYGQYSAVKKIKVK